MAVTPRNAAYSLLLQLEKQNGYSNLMLENSAVMQTFDTRDRAFVSALVYGVIERKITLDYQLSLYLTKPLKKLQPQALCLLRLGAYQILFSDRIPDSAAANETVALSKKVCPYAAGLINAVLRKVAQNGLCLPQGSDFVTELSVRYSCPEPLVSRWLSDYGKADTIGILESSLQPLGLSVRVNTVKTNVSALQKVLQEQNVESELCDLPDALRLTHLPCAVDRLPAFSNGLFHVQDKASMLCSLAVQPQPGQTVFDLCAAPGGKSFTMAQLMQNKGRVLSFDLYEKRVGLIKTGAQRLGLSCVEAATGDAASFHETIGLADRVLCDVPCSGLGVMRQKPEVKYKDLSELTSLPVLQEQILENGARYLKEDGRLVYSTCALDRRENEDVCAAFLKRNPQFEPVAPLPELSNQCFFTLMPHKLQCDGFFIAAFQKRRHS